MLGSDFQLSVVGSQKWDLLDDNIDVEVRFPNGARFTATFFTVENLKTLFAKNHKTGECSNGTYFWATEMIIVENLKLASLHATIEGLLRDNEFKGAFTRVPDEGCIEM